MTKTPEDIDNLELLAASYACDYRDSPSKTNGVPDSYLVYSVAYDGFLAGYQAAKDEEATKDQKIAELWTESIKKMLPSVHEVVLFPGNLTKASEANRARDKDRVADASKVMNSPEKPDSCEHILDMEKMVDVNSSNNSNGWISVKERLPEDGDDLSIMLVWRSIEHDYDTVRWRYQQGWDCVVQDKSTITHWMSLPKPPEEKK